MSAYNVSFMLVIDGCPIAFGSGSCPPFLGISSDDDGWITTGTPTLVQGSLVPTGWSWEESLLNLVQGDTQVGGLSFLLNDRPMTIEGSVRARGVTYLATRKATRGSSAIVNSQLSTTITSTGLSIVVDSGSLFDSGASIIYLDQEAILVNSRSSNTFTVNAVGRGYLGSIKRPHTVDDLNGYHPRVWASFPGFDNRRVTLWQISHDLVATRLWGGYCSDIARKGTGYELTCEHMIVTERSRPVGIPAATPRLRGYNTKGAELSLSWPGAARVLSTERVITEPDGGRIVNSSQEFIGLLQSAMRAQFADASIVGNVQLATDGPQGAIRFSASVDIAPALQLHGSMSIDFEQFAADSTEAGDPRSVSIVGRRMPPVIVYSVGGASASIPITSIANLPTSWTPTTTADGGLATTLSALLRGQIDESHWVVIEPTLATDVVGSGTVNGGPFVTGVVRTEAADGTAQQGVHTRVAAVLQTQVLITSLHWLLALRRGMVEDSTFANSAADSRDWDWTSQGEVLRATQNAGASMQLYLDGATTLDGAFRERFKANACSIGIRDGRLSPMVFRPPMPTDRIAMTVVSSQLAKPPEWKRLRNALVNVVEVEAGRGLRIVVRDQQSAARYGSSAPLQIKLGQNEIRQSAEHDPFTVASEVLTRLFGTFGNPVSIVTITLGPSSLTSASHGDYVRLSDWLSPDGNGNVGLDGVVGQVILRAPQNLGGSGECTVRWTLLLYGQDALAGFAPAVRVNTLGFTNFTNDTITVATGYLSSVASDYAGSNLPGYFYADDEPDDGGTSWVEVGDVLRFTERNTTTPHAPENATVAFVDPATKTIIFEAGTSTDWTAIAAAGNLDAVPVVYADSTANQQRFCYVATATPPHEIGGSATLARVFA